MKRIHLGIAAIALLAGVVVSCEREKELQPTEIGDNGLAFSVNSVATRGETGKMRGVTIPLGEDGVGNNYVLEESIETLGVGVQNEPLTKGSPAFTDNVSDIYSSLNAVAYAMDGTKLFGGDTKFEWNGNLYVHDYPNISPWTQCTDEDQTLYFFLRMPEILSEDVAKEWSYSVNDGSIQFDYVTPGTGSEQQDVLVTSRPLKKAEYDKEKGAQVLFYHALTGVKFAIGNDNSGNVKTYITNVKFNGLIKNGSCTVTPDGKIEQTTGDSKNVVVWNVEGSETGEFSQGFETTNVVDLKGNLEKNGKNNLNDSDASMTFWFIPQTMNSGITLDFTFKVGENGEEITRTINFGEVLAGVEWKAGQLRTYTLRANDVNIRIEDTVTETVKSGVTITNTGNVDAFIRAAIVGQWVDKDGAPVFSFTDFTVQDKDKIILEIDSWYNDQFGNGIGKFGVFNGLVGYSNSMYPTEIGEENADWVKGNDGYYYYTKVVKPGQATGTKLFNTYTIKSKPEIRVAGDLQVVNFVMEISTQAISANKSDGGVYTSYTDAWENANNQ